MMALSRVRFLTLLAAPICAVACGRLGYDVFQPGFDSGTTGFGGSGGSILTGAGGGAGTGGAGGGAGQGGTTGGAGGTSAGGSTGAGGATDASSPDGALALTCPQPAPPTTVWGFATDFEGWELSGTGTMVWTGSIGDPTPGALQVDWSSGSAIHPRLVQPLGDLRGRILTAEVWLDFGVSATAKLFVQTSARYDWADGGALILMAGQWNCLTLDLDNPVFAKQMYDPSDVQIIGFELDTGGPSRVYLDEIAY